VGLNHVLDGVSNNTILVMCNSSATCATLSNYLSTMTTETGASVMMGEKLRDYFKWKAHLGQMVRNLKKNKGGSSKNSNKSFNKTGDIPVVVDNEPVVIQESAAMKKKREMAAARGKAPSAKRRRIRGSGNIEVGNGRVTLAESARADPDALEAEAGEIADLLVFPSFFALFHLE
jgi:DNA excision repair protein ERCC-4